MLSRGGLGSLGQFKAWQLHPVTVQTSFPVGVHIKHSPAKLIGKLTTGCLSYLFIFHIKKKNVSTSSFVIPLADIRSLPRVIYGPWLYFMGHFDTAPGSTQCC